MCNDLEVSWGYDQMSTCNGASSSSFLTTTSNDSNGEEPPVTMWPYNAIYIDICKILYWREVLEMSGWLITEFN